MKKYIIPSAILLISVLLYGCIANPNSSAKPEIKVTPPETFVLSSKEVSGRLELTGNVEAKKQIPVSAKIVGRLDNLFVDVGSEVRKGQILARYSSIDNESQIQYQNAINQLRSTERASKNMIQSAMVSIETTERNLEQVNKERNVQHKKQYENLKTTAKLSETTISNTLNFMDQNSGASRKFEGKAPYQIGQNNSILKNDLKNKIRKFRRTFENLITEDEVFAFTQKRLNLLKELNQIFLDFDRLVTQSSVSMRLSQNSKDALLRQNAQHLKNLSTEITHLESQITQTKVLDEQLQLKVLSAQNAVKSNESSLEVTQSRAQNQITTARSSVNLAYTAKREMVVKAPFSGVIVSKFVDLGQLVSPGQIMFELADISNFKIKTDIADQFIGDIEKDQVVEISVDGLGDEVFSGKITKINPALDPKTKKLGLEVTFDTENTLEKLKIGLFTRIKINLPKHKAFFVPRDFVQFDFDGAKIKTSQKIVLVEIVSETDEQVEINFKDIKEGLKILKN